MFNSARHYTLIDNCLRQFDQTLRALAGINNTDVKQSPSPALGQAEADLNAAEKRYIAGLMRVNHTGEVCAQALYQGQALTARANPIKAKLEQAAQEETAHLTWCAERLQELNSRPSFLNPLWYMGSLTIGVAAGLISDEVSLGFLAETEQQVEQHLTQHLNKLPAKDQKSRAILEKMRADEKQHANTAWQAGAKELPMPIKLLMRSMSKVMTKTAFWV